uniref:DUF5655 domain-containing protein n=1 Tax=Caenorhabditis tropicalis TaxID=1561998 RepID=A0A1I7TLD8_9PELO
MKPDSSEGLAMRVAEANLRSNAVVPDTEFTKIMILDYFPSVLERFYGRKVNVKFISNDRFHSFVPFVNQKFFHYRHQDKDLFLEIKPDDKNGQKIAMKYLRKYLKE